MNITIPSIHAEKRKETGWLRLSDEILKLTYLFGFSIGGIVGLIRSPKHNLAQMLLFMIYAIHETLVIAFIFFLLHFAILISLRRFNDTLNWIGFAVNAVLMTPLFVVWVYRINVLSLAGFFSMKSIFWNFVFSISFVIAWFLISQFLAFWTKSRILNTQEGRHKGLTALLGIAMIALLLLLRFPPSLTEEAETSHERLQKGNADTPKADSKNPPFNHGEIQVYAFDENLKDANVLEAPVPILEQSVVRFDFDDGDAGKWKPLDDRLIPMSAREGLLRMRVQDAPSGIQTENINAPAADVFGIVLRMKVSKGDYFVLSWKRPQSSYDSCICQTRIRIPENGQFIVYKIQTIGLRDWSGVIDGLRLRPTDADGSEIDLDYIHFLTGHQYYSEGIGTGVYKTDSEFRKILYAHSPSSIQFRKKMPQRAFMSFGMTILDAKAPTDFEVFIDDERGQEKIYSSRIEKEGWYDTEIDMSTWQGKEVNITFKTSSPKTGSVAFWSNPILYSTTAAKRPPNVLLYVIDCLRADHTGPYGYSRNTTHHLNRFLKDGVLFLNAYSQYTSTRSSVASLFTSQYYSTHRVNHRASFTGAVKSYQRLPDHFQTIAEELRNRGYGTNSFFENRNVGPEGNLDQGFERVFFRGLNNDGERYGNISRVIGWIKNEVPEKRAFFLYLHTLEIHEPYEPPEPNFSLYNPQLKGRKLEDYKQYLALPHAIGVPEKHVDSLVDVYDGAINLADKRFGELIETLKEMKMYDNTLIIVTADHGELFYEHDLWLHGTEPYQGLIKVPLIMKFPSLSPGERIIDENVQLIDVAPTILDLLGFSVNKEFQGVSLLPLIRNQNMDLYQKRSIYSEGLDRMSVKKRARFSDSMTSIQDKWKFKTNRQEITGEEGGVRRILQNIFPLLFDFYKISRDELYDLKTDPTEKYNVSAIEPSILDRHRKDAKKWLELQEKIYSEKTDSIEKGTMIIDPQAQEELKALGYVQ